MSDIDLDFTGDAEPVLPVRKCSICDKALSRYNETDRCFHHKTLRQERREALLAQAVEKASSKELTAMAIQTKQESLARLAKDRLIESEEENTLQSLIFDLVCHEFDVTREEIIKPSRKPVFVEPRQVLMYLLYNDTTLSYPDIGELLDGRDHTTIIHGAKKIEVEILSNQELSKRIQLMRATYKK